MVRPSVASLNSLAKILRQASPLYADCRSILNYLGESGILMLSQPKTSANPSVDGVEANKDANDIPLDILELRGLDPKEIM